ncbi:MAG: serine hydrolase [Hyphomicrobiales bacterium]|nr:serine hydrolase [Hyphomicrobiales bacterium]MBV8825429.1 serine hydrolase [Hyphomicrobiales bacterium]MBV9426514.1 serine hydrolase [Bradyrhizobiaceae bacterium]
MTGFPPPPEGQITLANWRTAPFNRWAFQHVREIVPSAAIPHAPERIWALPSAPADLSAFSFEHDGARLDFDGFLGATDTDGIVILHRGMVVAERYAHGMLRQTPHILMSVSKSLLGIVAGILSGHGILDPNALVTRLIPEITNTAYAGATVSNLLDMRAGVHFDEDYLATSGPIVDYRKASNWNPVDPGDAPSDLRSFFARLTRTDGPHDWRFHYVSPNTDLMGWVIERAADTRYADLLSALLWQPMGAEHSAYITVDRLGAPRCAGGVCATVMDLARVGQLMVQGGKRDGVQIIPAEWLDDLIARGSAEAWNNGDFAHLFGDGPMHYRDKWYVARGAEPLVFGYGIHGQHLYVDRANELVVAKVSSQAAPIDEKRISLTMQAIAALRRRLS